MKVLVDYDRIPPRPDLVPPRGVDVLAKVFGYGSLKHEKSAWRMVTIGDHVDKAASHIREFLEHRAEPREDHLANALCRLYMAVELRELDKGR